ncbi:RNA polymerase sigma factor [Streptomyces sp. NPDC002688]|uniref:RNA polymerase sigma factor n=1 Tax=Streptomyces sp. NPDC002688 TaxID=3154423 RepID=UPI003326F559
MSQLRGSASMDESHNEAGRQEAMRRFYVAQHPRLLRFVARRVGDEKGAEDVCQETWRVFFFGYDKFIAAYDDLVKALYPIASCRIADYWRLHGQARGVPTESETLAVLTEALCAGLRGVGRFEAGDESADRRIDVQRALAKLPRRQREALELHYLYELKVHEAARLMGVSENAVKKSLKKGLAGLRVTDWLDCY